MVSPMFTIVSQEAAVHAAIDTAESAIGDWDEPLQVQNAMYLYMVGAYYYMNKGMVDQARVYRRKAESCLTRLGNLVEEKNND